LAYVRDVENLLSSSNDIESEMLLGNTLDIVSSFQQYLINLASQNTPLSTITRKSSALNKYLEFINIDGGIIPSKIPELQSNYVKYAIRYSPEILNKFQLSELKGHLQNGNFTLIIRDRLLFQLLVEEGISVKSIISLDTIDFNNEAGIIKFSNEKRNSIKISFETNKQIIFYLQEARKDLIKIVGENALMVSQFGTRISRQAIWLICSNWKKQYDLPFSTSPRILIHSGIKRMIQKNIGIQELKIRLGHKNILSTKSLVRKLKTI